MRALSAHTEPDPSSAKTAPRLCSIDVCNGTARGAHGSAVPLEFLHYNAAACRPSHVHVAFVSLGRSF